MGKTRVRALGVVAIFLSVACGSDDEPGPSTAVHTKNYSKACAVETDCVAVYEGNACSACQCENAAVAKTEHKNYLRDLGFAEGRCTSAPACAADCRSVTVTCTSGTCGIAP